MRAALAVLALAIGARDARAQTASANTDSIAAALYARAIAADNAEDARRDFLRVAIDYSNSPRAEDALLQLAKAELTRGDTTRARFGARRLHRQNREGGTSGFARARRFNCQGRGRGEKEGEGRVEERAGKKSHDAFDKSIRARDERRRMVGTARRVRFEGRS